MLVTVQSVTTTDSDDEKLMPPEIAIDGPAGVTPTLPPRFHEKPLVVLELPVVVAGEEFIRWIVLFLLL